MNKAYLSIIEKSLSAYSETDITQYFNDVKQNGLKDQGFARLTVNIGVLISYGLRTELSSRFLEMMEFCCKTIPVVKADNDFSVRELVCCISELERSGAVESEYIVRWKGYLATIEPTKCYTKFAEKPSDTVQNWAIFCCLSEFFRQKMGLCDSSEFIDTQIASQLKRFDENGMYMDGNGEIRHPFVYDISPRALFSLLLFAGYRGQYYETLDGLLKKAGLLTLKMQSVTGEIPFGGRSNQLLHNEGWLAAVCEYEAVRYKKEGNLLLAGQFKRAALQALEVAENWLSKTPISHVKNRFPRELNFGCEKYAYFNKYMISTGSVFYMASLMCDDSISPVALDDAPMVWSTSKHFHKTFVRAGGYSLQFGLNENLGLDANGLGRVHKKGAPSAICLSMPCPLVTGYLGFGDYHSENGFSICPSIKKGTEWLIGAGQDVRYELRGSECGKDFAYVIFDCIFDNGEKVEFICSVDKNGVSLQAKSNGAEEVGIAFPVFCFDGEKKTKITQREDTIIVEYDGWACEYTARSIKDLRVEHVNRNGVYKGYLTTGNSKASLAIKIYLMD